MLILEVIKKVAPATTVLGVTSTTSYVVASNSFTEWQEIEEVSPIKAEKHLLKKGSDTLPEDIKDGKLKNWQLILKKLGAPKEDVEISEHDTIEWVLYKTYKKMIKKDVDLKKDIKEKWSEIIKAKPKLSGVTGELTKKFDLAVECHSAEKKRLNDKDFEKELNFYVDFCAGSIS